MSIISQAKKSDIPTILQIEEELEGKHAASKKTLEERLKMLNEGFLVARDNKKIIGYLESCRWGNISFETFEEIRDFPKLHKADGKTLYVMMIGVSKEKQGQGVGSELVKGAISLARKSGCTNIQAVVKNGFEKFFKRQGFSAIRVLPNYMPGDSVSLMELRLEK